MRIRVGAATDIGQVREGNEDAYLVEDPLYAVADGMGGHRGGEVASNLALETIHNLFAAQEGSLSDQVQEANRAVFERSQTDRAVAGMGTTLTAALVQGAQIRLAHVGDSRAYLFRDGTLHLLTEDHTLVHRMVQEGEITEDEAETHPHRSILTRALGVDGAVQVDEGTLEMRNGDRLLLCTDGLTGMLSDRQIASILEQVDDPQEAADRLVRAANRAGGVDNVTAVILDLVEDGDRDGAGTERRMISNRTTERRTVTIGEPSTTTSRSGAPAPALGRRRTLRRAGIGAGVTVAVFVVGLVALRVFLDTQWYVGVSDGRVAIFRGIPADIAGVELSSVIVQTDIPAADVQDLALYPDLEQGITVEDRQGAEAVVDGIREDLAAAAEPAGP